MLFLYLLISINELLISIIHLLISIIWIKCENGCPYTLVFSALISEFFLAISKSNLPVIVLASPRSSCARCSVVSGPVTSSDVIAASSASISIVDWLDG